MMERHQLGTTRIDVDSLYPSIKTICHIRNHWEVAMHAHITRRLFLAGSSASVVMLSRAIRASAEQSIDEVRWALPSINDTMFVPRAWSTYVGAIMSLVQEGPLAFGDDLSLQPAI